MVASLLLVQSTFSFTETKPKNGTHEYYKAVVKIDTYHGFQGNLINADKNPSIAVQAMQNHSTSNGIFINLSEVHPETKNDLYILTTLRSVHNPRRITITFFTNFEAEKKTVISREAMLIRYDDTVNIALLRIDKAESIKNSVVSLNLCQDTSINGLSLIHLQSLQFTKDDEIAFEQPSFNTRAKISGDPFYDSRLFVYKLNGSKINEGHPIVKNHTADNVCIMGLGSNGELTAKYIYGFPIKEGFPYVIPLEQIRSFISTHAMLVEAPRPISHYELPIKTQLLSQNEQTFWGRDGLLVLEDYCITANLCIHQGDIIKQVNGIEVGYGGHIAIDMIIHQLPISENSFVEVLYLDSEDFYKEKMVLAPLTKILSNALENENFYCTMDFCVQSKNRALSLYDKSSKNIFLTGINESSYAASVFGWLIQGIEQIFLIDTQEECEVKSVSDFSVSHYIMFHLFYICLSNFFGESQ